MGNLVPGASVVCDLWWSEELFPSLLRCTLLLCFLVFCSHSVWKMISRMRQNKTACFMFDFFSPTSKRKQNFKLVVTTFLLLKIDLVVLCTAGRL